MDTFASNFGFLSCYGKPYPTTQKTGTTNIWVGKQKNRKTKEITEIQQIILALHIVKKERRKPNRQVNIVKLSRKGFRECQEEMEHERVPTAPKKEEEERKFAR